MLLSHLKGPRGLFYISFLYQLMVFTLSFLYVTIVPHPPCNCLAISLAMYSWVGPGLIHPIGPEVVVWRGVGGAWAQLVTLFWVSENFLLWDFLLLFVRSFSMCELFSFLLCKGGSFMSVHVFLAGIWDCVRVGGFFVSVRASFSVRCTVNVIFLAPTSVVNCDGESYPFPH